MKNYDKMLRDLHTKDGKERVYEFFDGYEDEVVRRNNKIREMFSNLEYMNWLEKFTSSYPEFYDREVNSCFDYSDQEQVNCLRYFFDGIYQYAKINNKFPNGCNYGVYYTIKKDQITYQIGKLYGERIIYFCNRVNDDKESINFYDIMNSYHKVNEKNLNELSEKIISLCDHGIPLSMIEATVVDAMDKVRSHQKAKNILIKRKKYYK